MVRLYSSARLSPRAPRARASRQLGSDLRASGADRGLVMLEQFPATDARPIAGGAERLVGLGSAASGARSIPQGDQVGRGTNKAAFAHFDRGPTRCLRKAFQDGFADDYSNRCWKAHDTFRIESGLIINCGLHPELFLQAPDRNFVHLQLRCISAVRLTFNSRIAWRICQVSEPSRPHPAHHNPHHPRQG